MTTLNDFNYVDDSDDVMAVHVNDLVASSLRSEYKNAETLSATRTLLDVDTPLQRFDCNGANRIVKMPTADAVENHPYLIVNATASGTYTLTVQNNGATITHAVLNPSEFILMVPDGNGTYAALGRPFNGVLTPSQITSNQDNYNPTGAGAADVIRISSDAARSITGLAFPAQNKTIVVTNVGAYTITLVNDATSTAENRFLLGADFSLEAYKSVILIYDATSSRWRMVGGGGGGGSSDAIGQKRLSLTSNTPVTTADVTAATTVYWTDGTTNLSVAVPSTTVTPFDVFYDTGAGTLSTVNWTNDTTRATALVRASGRLAKTGDTAKIYLGTGRTTSVSGQCEDSETKRFLWNMYNRLERSLNKYESTNSWTYTTATWRSANNSTANRVEFIQGVDENRIVAEVAGLSANSSAGNYGLFGLALDVTNTNHCAADGVTYLHTVGAANQVLPTYGRYSKHVGVGYHFLQWTEYSNGSGTNTFYSFNSTQRQSGIVGRVIG